MSGLVLDIGCGKNPHPNADVTLDIKREVEPTIICDVRKLPFKDEVFDGLYCWEIVEHFGPREIHPLMTEWTRVLKHGGFIDIKTPDCWRLNIISVFTYPFMKNYHYMKTTEQSYDPGTIYDYHKTSFTRDSLKRLLREHEIGNIKFSNYKVERWKGIIAKQVHYVGRKR